MTFNINTFLGLAAVIRGLYGLRPAVAAVFERLGVSGVLYDPIVTASFNEVSAFRIAFYFGMSMSYLLIAWGALQGRRWLAWFAGAVYLIDETWWILTTFDPHSDAVHASVEADAGFDPALIDWAMFGLETLIFTGALYIALTARRPRS